MSSRRTSASRATPRTRAAQEPAEREVFRVGDLLRGLGQLLEDQVGRIWVLGEISNLHSARSGHSYFTLKDEAGQIRAALFRNDARRLPFELEEGMEVVAHADVSIYAARGDLQLIVRQLEPRGVGALQLAFEQLRRRLESEGLFAPERKREIPAMPRRIGVVTSPTSAAVRDVLQVTGRRFPAIPIVISPTRVQGAGAEDEIAAAIRRLADGPELDVVLVVRGGGSLEDLWAFNTEIVARAIAQAPWPVISGVGHETDVTIADLVADARAATPSVAAALAVPDHRSLLAQLARTEHRLIAAMRVHLRHTRADFERVRDTLRGLAPLARLEAHRQRLAAADRALARSLAATMADRRGGLATAAGRLDALSPLAVLSRGFAVVRKVGDARILRRAADVEPGDRLGIRLAEAEVEATALSVRAAPPTASDDPDE